MRIVLTLVITTLAVAAGVGTWIAIRPAQKVLPDISAYSEGHSVRVGPYVYCNVVNLDDCRRPQTQGQLPVTERHPVQLSVPQAIGRAPWRLLQVYDDPANTETTIFKPGSRLAVTIPTFDAHRGRLNGIVVQLLTLVVDPEGELHEAPHAEWSVQLHF